MEPPKGIEPLTYSLHADASHFSGGGVMRAEICGDLHSPGEVYEHWCELEPGHTGDHSCGDCGDVWNPEDPAQLAEFGPELHERWDGTCAECVSMREAVSDSAPHAG